MKRLKFLPSVLMLVACVAVLCVGIYAVSPVENQIGGSLTVSSMAKVNLTVYSDYEEIYSTKKTADGITFDLGAKGALDFNASNASTKDDIPQRVIRIRIENITNKALGAYFYNGDSSTLTADGLATYDSLSHEEYIYQNGTTTNPVAKATLSTYTYIAASDGAEGGYDEVDMYMTIDVERIDYEDLECTFWSNLRIEEYQSGTTTGSSDITLMKLTEASGDKTSVTYVSEYKIPNNYESSGDYDRLEPISTTEQHYLIPQINDTNVGVVVIPTSYTGIAEKAFSNCSKLKALIIPNSITYVDSDGIFDNCPVLTQLSVPLSGPYYCTQLVDDEDGQVSAYYDTNPFVLYFGKAEEKYDEEDESYYFECYDNHSLAEFCSKRYYLDSGLSLYEVRNIPNSLNMVYFSDETLLSIDYYGSNLMYSSYSGSIILGQNCESIGYGAFEGVTNLKDIYISCTVKSIGIQAFKNCTGLKTISIPDTIESIGQDAFYGCTNLKYNTYENCYYLGNKSNPYVCLVSEIDSSKTTYSIHEDAKLTAYGAFSGNKNIQSITIPENFAHLGESTFSGCTALVSIDIPSQVKSIGYGTFYACTSLAKITVKGDGSGETTTFDAKLPSGESWSVDTIVGGNAEYWDTYSSGANIERIGGLETVYTKQD